MVYKAKTKKTSGKKIPKSLKERVDRWNKNRTKLMKEYAAIQREADKRGLTTTRSRKR